MNTHYLYSKNINLIHSLKETYYRKGRDHVYQCYPRQLTTFQRYLDKDSLLSLLKHLRDEASIYIHRYIYEHIYIYIFKYKYIHEMDNIIMYKYLHEN